MLCVSDVISTNTEDHVRWVRLFEKEVDQDSTGGTDTMQMASKNKVISTHLTGINIQLLPQDQATYLEF
jgi:hypothetical protein